MKTGLSLIYPNKMFKVVTNLGDLMKVFVARGIVFIEKQGVPYIVEHDEHDLSATHILGEMDGEPFAAGRIRAFGEYAKKDDGKIYARGFRKVEIRYEKFISKR
jgi:hypothetical protein